MDTQLKADLTEFFARCRKGDVVAAEKMLALLYSELHELAHRHTRGRPAGHMLQPTALVKLRGCAS